MAQKPWVLLGNLSSSTTFVYFLPSGLINTDSIPTRGSLIKAAVGYNNNNVLESSG